MKVTRKNEAMPNQKRQKVNVDDEDEEAEEEEPAHLMSEEEIRKLAQKTVSQDISFLKDSKESDTAKEDPLFRKFLESMKKSKEHNFEFEDEVSQEVKDMNRDHLYDMEFRKRRNIDFSESKRSKKHKALAEQDNQSLQEF